MKTILKQLRCIILMIPLLSLFCPVIIYAQNISVVDSRVRNSLENHYKRYPQEKLFLHSDAGLYANGQTIWYKIYAMAYGKPSALSTIAYVVLADSAGNAIVKNKVPMKHGRAHGNIALPDNLHSGWYQLVCFTAWTMNFGETEAFHKKIYIQNLGEGIPSANRSGTDKKYHIAFYPEGGELVEGGLCRVAFKAWDDNGNPVKAEGEITDDSRKLIVRLTTVHDGMGLFSIEGIADKADTAVVKFPDNSTQKIALPVFKKTGLVLKADPSFADRIEVRITLGGNMEQYRDVVLAAYQDNGTFNTYPVSLSQGIDIVNIKKKDYSNGILRLTLFSSQGVPEAERIVFNNTNDEINLSLEADSISFNARAKSAFSLRSLRLNGKSVVGNFSVSVTDADAVGEDEAIDNIASSLFMSSELTGKVYHPSYYFKNNSDSLRQQLDLVMLTNGWRRFKWNKDTVVLKNPVERSQFIAGHIAGYDEQVKAGRSFRVKLIVQNQDSTKYFAYVEPDSAGRFILRDYTRQGRAAVFLQARDNKDRLSKLKLSLYNTFADSLQMIRYSQLDSTLNTVENINSYFISNAQKERQQKLILQGRLLKTVNIHDRKLTPTEELIKNHVKHLETNNAFTLDLINGPIMRSANIIDNILGRFPGLQITLLSTNPPAYRFTYHGPSTLGQNNSTPLIYVNESQTPFEDVLDIPITDVALIQFVPPPVWFAPLNGGSIGALMIYTKKFGDEKSTRSSLFQNYTFDGYTITREFAARDYSRPQPKITTDTRTTLYWNYDLDTYHGESKFSFYNSDNAKHYRVIIQGMDADGRIGYLEKVY